jgi:hypothetical protein
MSSEFIELFTDTNTFIHLRDLKDLPWRDIFPDAKCINIIVASRVIEELDDLKNSNNGRKRDRARLALKLIESASKSENHSLVIRDSPIEIRIAISSAAPPDWSKTPRLDPQKPDDQLVAEAVTYGNTAVLFSYDTGPRIRARLANIAAFEPLDDWQLPAEQTDDQRKITQLERNLERALSTFPKILAFFGSSSIDTSVIEFPVPILNQIDLHTVERLTAAYLANHPPERLSIQPDHLRYLVGRMGAGYTEYEVEKYEKEYAAFRHQVRNYFEKLHETIHRVAHALSIDYVIRNDSSVSANGLRIEVSLVGKATLLGDEVAVAQFAGTLSPPTPPKKPEGMRDVVSAYLGRQSLNKPRDPTGFYWFERPAFGSKHSALQCEDFRATRVRKDEVLLWIEGDVPFSGQLTLQISATNLPAPITVVVALSVSEREMDWSDEYVLKLLPASIRDLFGRVK